MNLKKDLFPIFKKQHIEFVDKRTEVEGIKTFSFKSDPMPEWEPGQHGIFTITHKKIKKATRPFSVASIHQEGLVKITTNIDYDPSDYKEALDGLTQGMTIRMRGPIGGFYIKENKPTLMLAMGLGITPYRALLKSLELKNGDGGTVALQAPIELLYYNRTGTFLYEDELNTLCEKTQTTKELLTDFAKFQSEIKAFVNHHEDDGRYFVVGSPKMTKELVAFLRGLGINKKHILKDSFIGH